MTSNVPAATANIYHANRSHIVYNATGSATHVYETDNANAVEGGACKVTKFEYNTSGYKTGSVEWQGNYWEIAWNLTTTI